MKIKEKFNKFLDIASIKSEVKYLRKEVEELRQKEKPYIDKITKLKSEIRVLRIQNTKMKNKLGVKENEI
jgi:uncharacterized protein (DUF2132 family)